MALLYTFEKLLACVAPEESLVENPQRCPGPHNDLNLLTAFADTFQLVGHVFLLQVGLCSFRTFLLLYFFLKLFTFIKLAPVFWQNPVPGGILKKSHVDLKYTVSSASTG